MYSTLLFLHSGFRWLVLVGLLFAIQRAYRGYASRREFTPADHAVRHWTATLAHLQLLIGFTLYFNSPITRAIWASGTQNTIDSHQAFFGIIHLLLMLVAIVVITIGSALAKRRSTGQEKFKTMGVWFFVGLVIIFLAIPWPFSPLANRPYVRSISL